jgi:two-component system CheB/CheR fusion protein
LLWVDDANGERFANRAYLDFVGVAQGEVQGKQWHEFIYPDDRERYLATYREAASRNAPFETQVRLRRANGQYRWMKSIATPRGGSGDLSGFVGSETDVADLKEAELALVHADRGRNEFLAMLAHELRNPLAPLRNVVQLLQVKGGDKATVDWAWGTLDRQVRNLTLLVDDLLDVSRITHGKINLRREPTDLMAALRNAASLLEPTITARHQSLMTDLPTRAIQVNADQLRLEQIFGNLLSNASKFTPEHGQIWLTAKELPDASMVEVNIRDDGIGIGAETLPDVFDLFSQGERSLNRAHGGLGIGLTVVRRLVNLHGGEVTARSPGPGRGSEFVVRLPTVTPAVARVAPDAAPGAFARRAPAGPVLLIDDNVDARDGLAELLRKRGY